MGSKSQDICADPTPSDPLPSSPKLVDKSVSTVSTLSLPKHFKRNNKNNFRTNIKLSKQIGTQRLYSKMVTHTRSSSEINNMRRGRQPTVAIATQVLNPSSLKGSRITKRFGPRDDDEEGFFTYQQRRTAWKRLCYYGITITATILVLMAFIIAVGYFQSEKQKKTSMTRSVKLVQERRPLSYVYTSTPSPPLDIEPTDSFESFPTTHSYFLGGYESKEQFDPGEVGKSSKTDENDEDDYIINYDLEDFDVKMKETNDENATKGKDSLDNVLEQKENHTPKNRTIISHSTSVIDDDTIKTISNNINGSHNEHERDSWKSIVQLNKEDDDTISQANEKENSRFPSEVKVLPPQDFAFSIEIPIYKPNKTISSGDQEMNRDQRINDETNKGSGEDDRINDAPIKTNHDKVHELPLIINEVSGATKDSTKEEISSNESVSDSIRKEDEIEEHQNNGVQYNSPEHETDADQDKFHESILHTVLFQAEDEDGHSEDQNRKSYDSFEDRLREPATVPEANVESREKENSSGEKIESIKPSRLRGRGRSRKIKMMRNDTTLNFKASYSPPPSSSRIVNPREKDNKQKSIGKGIIEKIDLENSSDFGNIKDFVMAPYHSPRRPQSSETTASSLSTSSEEDKPRLLSSSPSSFASNLEAFLRTILSSTGKLNLHSKTNTPEPSRKILDVQNPHGISDYGASLASNVNQLFPSSSYPGLGLDSSHLRYNPAIGSLGSPSIAGATLNNFYPNYFPSSSTPQPNNFAFDISSSGTDDVPRLAPGVVPLDLASSYIPSALSLSNSRLSFPSSSSTSNIPNFQAPFTQNIGGNGNVNPFLLNNGDVGSLTTIGGQPPQYNTISQGIHLLNMISGVNPSTYFHDQVYPQSTTHHSLDGGTLNPSASTPSHFLLGNLQSDRLHDDTDLAYTAAASPSSSTASTQSPFSYPHVNANYNKNGNERGIENDHDHDRDHDHPVYYSPPAQSTRPRYSFLRSREDSYSLEESDQLPAASSSFSQSILTTFKKPTKKPKVDHINSKTLPPPPRVGSESLWKSQTEPKSFTMEILPGRTRNKLGSTLPTGNIIDDTLTGLSADIIHSSLDNFVSGSKSKKRAGANLAEQSQNNNGGGGNRSGKVLKLKGFELKGNRAKAGNNSEGGSNLPIIPRKKVSFSSSNANWPLKKSKTGYSKDAGLQSGFYQF